VSIQVRKPEVLLVPEPLTSPSTGGERISAPDSALLFRTELLFDYSKHPGRESMVCSLASLEILAQSPGGRKRAPQVVRVQLFLQGVVLNGVYGTDKSSFTRSIVFVLVLILSHANVRRFDIFGLFPQVLFPCDIELAKSFKSVEEGTKVTGTVSAVDIHLSASTVHTILDVSKT